MSGLAQSLSDALLGMPLLILYAYNSYYSIVCIVLRYGILVTGTVERAVLIRGVKSFMVSAT